ncbi:tetratricopeptide repeat-containing sensor histidine kinase [Fibrella aquatilis]|uniref:Histidine kinase n=1 Tax=Fibrella aquatilis TaxID=2817059 RepID=A0A939G0Q1_9BACT|nr:histidine kinase [Fibrella aquatilis]MBO0929809.1 histidine kinase [Fibrella aquatilis]
MFLHPLMNYHICLLLTGLLAAFSASAQVTPQQLDSLKKQSKLYLKKDTTRVKLLVTLGDAMTTIEPKEAIRYADESLRLAQTINWPMGVAAAYRQLGKIEMSAGAYAKAVDYHHKALAASHAIKSPDQRTLFEATEQNNLGTIYLNVQDYDKAIVAFTQFLNTVQRLKRPDLRREERIALLNLGEAYFRKRAFEKGITFVSRSLAQAETDHDYQVAAYALNSLGIAHTNFKQPTKSIELFKKGIVNAEKAGDRQISSMLEAGVADVLWEFERFDEAEQHAKQAMKLAQELNMMESQRQIAQLLGYIYIAQGKKQLAITNLDKATSLRDSLMSDEKKAEIARLEERFEQEKRTAVLNAQHTAELQQQQTKRNAIMGGAGALMLAAGVSFLFYKRKRDADEQVKAVRFDTLIADTKLDVLRSQINPHFIFNALNSISNYVLNNDPFTADRYLAKFASLMRAILDDSDRKETPLAEDMATLELYMELESLRLDHRFTYRIEIDPALDPQRTQIPPLLLQPFVENSIWHGLAMREADGLITIRVRQEGDMLVCSVTDNGIGRKRAAQEKQAQPTRKSHGLNITQARIEIINRLKKANGYVTLADRTDGTEATVGLPLSIA